MTPNTKTKKRGAARPIDGRNRETSEAKDGSARTVLPLTWSATEYVPKKRWWWFVIFGYVILTLTSLLLAAGNWSAALLTLTLGVTLFVMYLVKPREWNYTLNADELKIVGKTKRLTLPLEQFRAFTTEETTIGKDREPFVAFVLIPHRRFAVSRDVYLTNDTEKNNLIAEALAAVVPYEETPDNVLHFRVLDRLARLLRLS